VNYTQTILHLGLGLVPIFPLRLRFSLFIVQARHHIVKLERMEPSLSIPQLESLNLRGAPSTFPSNRLLQSPVHILPIDILSLIFSIREKCQPHRWVTQIVIRSYASYDHPSLLISNGPWHLAQVCQTWRAVATSTALLWADVIIQGGPPIGKKLRSDIIGSDYKMLSEQAGWLRLRMGLDCYSGETPLNITCRAIGIFTYFHKAAFLSHAERWRVLNIADQLPTLSLLGHLPLKGNYPLLTRLVIHEKYVKPIANSQVSLFERGRAASCAPNLRSMALDPTSSPQSIKQIPWGQIEDVTIGVFSGMNRDSSLTAVLNVLQQARKLRSMALNIPAGSIIPLSPTPLILSCLQKLRINSAVPLAYLHLPLLRALWLTLEGGDSSVESGGSPHLHLLSESPSRSGCQLQALDITIDSDILVSDLRLL
jgi:hypothetical protein